MKEDVLVVAFDGMDKELIEKFGLQNLVQEEVGTIDNKSDVENVKTAELFATFITGQTSYIHNISDRNNWTDPRKGKIVDVLTPGILVDNVRGFHRLRDTLMTLLDVRLETYNKDDIECTTIFEEIENSKPLFIPAYNESLFMDTGASKLPLKYGYGSEVLPEYYDDYEYSRRKREFMRPVNKFYDFCMVHFQRPDFHQHFYGDKHVRYEEEKLKDLYEEMDEFAAKILEFFSEDFETIIFMSDHGLPTEEEHNENAFYSSNKKLFPNKTPKMSEFKDKIKTRMR